MWGGAYIEGWGGAYIEGREAYVGRCLYRREGGICGEVPI